MNLLKFLSGLFISSLSVFMLMLCRMDGNNFSGNSLLIWVSVGGGLFGVVLIKKSEVG